MPTARTRHSFRAAVGWYKDILHFLKVTVLICRVSRSFGRNHLPAGTQGVDLSMALRLVTRVNVSFISSNSLHWRILAKIFTGRLHWKCIFWKFLKVFLCKSAMTFLYNLFFVHNFPGFFFFFFQAFLANMFGTTLEPRYNVMWYSEITDITEVNKILLNIFIEIHVFKTSL